MPILKNWTVQKHASNTIEGQPEIITLWGHIWEDEKGRFRDGQQVRTSQVLELDVVKGFAQTLNTRYELDKLGGYLVEELEKAGKTPDSLSGTWKSIF